jgi:hypothetical protein
MRTWMKAQGHQNKPLLITEYSILYSYENDGETCHYQDEYGKCFTPTRVSNYLRNTFDLVDGVNGMTDTSIGYPQDNYRLVQQALWFSVYTDLPGKVSNLYGNELLNTMTGVGSAFQAEMAERTPVPNLSAWNADNVAGFITAPASSVTVTLSVDVYNNGDTAVTSPTTVTFYANQAMTDVIGSTTVPNLDGCARGPVSVSVDWPDLTSGMHQYWVKVDSANVLAEVSESDNLTSGFVIIDPDQVFLPTLFRQ